MNKTVTLELPDALKRRLEAEDISESQLRSVLLAVIEAWLQERAQKSQPAERFKQSAAPFARRLIAQNRALFEELARR
jgi:hypothetical protein